ncbi:LemA protein [Inhella inkyongensis]|uniref:LemA protein n=1 Tax=Inhella inkyongensis TaxID=392593 RepID=A0A840RZY3_9BURK|nr:hypothetical protein [Inhella inkyongensis]MBB5202802.1 LemA protein [Inhella inkyongensis]
MSWALGLLLGVLLLWGLGAYSRLMRLRSAIASAWAQLEAPLQELSRQGLALAEAGPRWLPAESSAFEALRQHSTDLGAAVQAAGSRPHAADPMAQLAVTHALHAAALQRARALLEHHAGNDEDAGWPALLAALKQAGQQRDFGRQLFNQRVELFNQAIDELPTRLLCGVFDLHDAGKF